MDRPKRHLRRLVRDLKNPSHDKRTRYGIESVAVFKAGEAFTYRPAYFDTYREPASVALTKHHASGDLAEMFYRASEETKSRTFAELVLSRGDSNADAWAHDAIKAMLASGKLTFADLTVALDAAESALNQLED